MSRDPKVYLEDILESIRRINSFIGDLDADEFGGDELRLDAVIRNLEVIGEAVKCLPVEFRESQSQVEWRKIAGLRDILIHHYFGINVKIIWDVVKNKLPALETQIHAILKR